MQRYMILLFALYAVALCTVSELYAQGTVLESEIEAPGLDIQASADSLETLALLLTKKQQEIDRIVSVLKSEDPTTDQATLDSRLQQLRQERDELREHFLEIASGVDLAIIRDKKIESEFNWVEELKALLDPVIREVQRLTEGPRQIDYYKTEVEKLEEKIAVLTQAVSHIGRLMKAAHAETLPELKRARTFWLQHLEIAETRLSIMTQKLASAKSTRVPMLVSIENLLYRFFSSKGRNLIVAFIATIFFWFAARRVYSFLLSRPYFSKQENENKIRLVHVCFYLCSGLGAFFVFLFILFLFGDWILLFFGCILLLGVLWTSKAALPKLGSQIGLLLNVGPVREGERLTYNGLPWLVERIGFHSILSNPVLEGGRLRLPIADLELLRSRPFYDSEPWFPTEPEVWVFLEDETYGFIEQQTVEFVVLREKGGAKRTFPTLSFMSKTIRTLSDGYRLTISLMVPHEIGIELSALLATVEKELEDLVGNSSLAMTISLITIGQIEGAGIRVLFFFDCAGETASNFDLARKEAQLAVLAVLGKHAITVAPDLLKVTVENVSEVN